MQYVILVSVLILVQYQFFMLRAGSARGKGNVKAPAISGDDNFERNLRVQLNTLEQLAITLPAMWICAVYFRTDVAAVLGTLFLIGRFVYSSGYLNDPAKRGPGMIIGFSANIALIICCLYAAVIRLI
ncbi:MAG: MAPEG family protein [Gammaproteobacteria bacterium]|nr:MAPEG family protein [Gammaproteobacteria bacterium]